MVIGLVDTLDWGKLDVWLFTLKRSSGAQTQYIYKPVTGPYTARVEVGFVL